MDKEGRDLASIVRNLDARFAVNETIAATDLQEKGVARLQERMASSHKLLLTHYNKPVGVLLDVEVFTALVTRLQELEDRAEDAEEAELAGLVDDRVSQQVPESKWLSREQFLKAAQDTLTEKPGRRSR